LALAVPKGSAIALDAELKGLGAAVRAGQVKRLAIANPDIAPYGAAAKAALMKTDLWSALADRIVIGENVGQTAQFVAAGAVEAGLVALSLTRAPELSQRLLSVAVDAKMYAPIRHAMAVMKTAGPVGESFAGYCLGSSARDVFERHGFLPPE
jgi:molybdate transport system substrate-binding protein